MIYYLSGIIHTTITKKYADRLYKLMNVGNSIEIKN